MNPTIAFGRKKRTSWPQRAKSAINRRKYLCESAFVCAERSSKNGKQQYCVLHWMAKIQLSLLRLRLDPWEFQYLFFSDFDKHQQALHHQRATAQFFQDLQRICGEFLAPNKLQISSTCWISAGADKPNTRFAHKFDSIYQSIHLWFKWSDESEINENAISFWRRESAP